MLKYIHHTNLELLLWSEPCSEHTAADNLLWLREVIDADISFGNMTPDIGIFTHLDENFRGMAWPEHEYVWGTNKVRKGIIANLPPGTWTVNRYDVIKKQKTMLTKQAKVGFEFDAPDSRAVLFHFRKNNEGE